MHPSLQFIADPGDQTSFIKGQIDSQNQTHHAGLEPRDHLLCRCICRVGGHLETKTGQPHQTIHETKIILYKIHYIFIYYTPNEIP